MDRQKTLTESYGKEILEAIAQIAERSPFQEELSYFLNAAHKHFVDDIKQPAPPLVVLGSSIPEELVCTGGRSPYWVLGGSRASSLWADGDVPRDTDPVSRSSLGYFNSGFGKDSLILVPLVSDSSRKLAYLLKTDGFKVHTFHFPPVKDQFFRTEWERQYESCRRAIAMHLKRPITKRQLKDSAETVGRAKKELQKFLSTSADVLPGSIRLFVTNSFYFADDLSLWAAQLESWSARLRHMFSSRMMEKRKVLLLGSPIYFPNYKVPLLIEDAGLEISGQADYSSLQLQSGIAGFYWQDASPAYVRNDSFFRQIQELAGKREVDGMVYHVLKGQIEYDFEFTRLEGFFESMSIPVFRLETDYNYQDVEQLRLRLEAFSEVLNQRRYGRWAAAI
ncbi:2-hydroxyacyl-CoA dehydratase [bacterium D16-76]|nr:2-hydroxyacyl-CoA dehydratase [bacterium D16-76]